MTTRPLSVIHLENDDEIRNFYEIHGRSGDYKELNPGNVAYYDGMVMVELDKIKPMIAMPFTRAMFTPSTN